MKKDLYNCIIRLSPYFYNNTIHYTPSVNYNGADSFDIKIYDGIEQDIITVNVLIELVNDAPVLSPYTPTMTGISEDHVNNSGVLISSIIGSSINDFDVGALSGIAIHQINNSKGMWQYSIDNCLNWLSMSNISLTSALLLTPQDKIRFVPDEKTSDQAMFYYHAWDQTSGTKNTQVDIATNGNISAFSIGYDLRSINVSEVNDAPMVEQNNNISVQEGNSITITNAYLEITDYDHMANEIIFTSHSIEPPSHGSLYINQTQITENESFTQQDINENRISYLHNGGELTPVQIRFNVSDSQVQVSDILFDINVIPVNDLPQIINNNLFGIAEGALKTIGNTFLQADDVDNNDSEIFFYLTQIPVNGSLQLNGENLGINDSFSQEQINSNNLYYQHDGTETVSDYFSFTITDGIGQVIQETTFNISITFGNDDPVLVNNNGLNLNEN